MLVLKAAVPQQNFLGVLVDDSRSMQIADRDGQPRSAFVQQQFGKPDAPLLKALSRALRRPLLPLLVRRPRGCSRPSDLKFDGTQTRLGAALDGARDELAGLPLAGLVMVTDGADTSDASLDDALLGLKARRFRSSPSASARRRFAHDIQIDRVVDAAHRAQGHVARSSTSCVTQTGYAGQTVPLDVEDDGRIVSSQEVTLPADGESATVRVRFTANEAGPRVFRFKVAPQPGEQVTQNNARDALIEVARSPREDPLLRRRAALRDEVHPPRGRRRQEPAGRHAAAHRREQVPARSTSTTPTSWSAASRRRARSCSRTAA